MVSISEYFPSVGNNLVKKEKKLRKQEEVSCHGDVWVGSRVDPES